MTKPEPDILPAHRVAELHAAIKEAEKPEGYAVVLVLPAELRFLLDIFEEGQWRA